MRRYSASLLAIAGAAAALGAPPPPPPPPRWTSSWEAAPQLTEVANDPPLPLAGTVVRQVLHASAGGATLRVQFGNVFGGGPVEVLAAHIAASAAAAGAPVDSSILASSDVPLTFAGAGATTIAAGACVWSDPVAFALPPLSNLVVTTAFGAASVNVSGHPGSRTTSYQLEGADVSAPSMPAALTAPHWYVLSGLDVAGGPAPARATIVLGDSITDGRGSTTDMNDRWPDVLANRLLAPNSTRANITSLVNAGIGGNAITGGGLGPTALARFSRDVLGRSGAACVVIFEGLRDEAAAAGLKVFGATITPFGGNAPYYSAAHEAARQAVNAFIRGGSFDAVLDFDTVLTDGGSPPKLRPEFDSGDGLHPNPAGYRALAGSVDLAIFDGL